MDAIPKSASGKIFRRVLKDQAKAEAEQQQKERGGEGSEKVKAKL